MLIFKKSKVYIYTVNMKDFNDIKKQKYCFQIGQNENNKTHTTSTATREDLIFIVHSNCRFVFYTRVLLSFFIQIIELKKS